MREVNSNWLETTMLKQNPPHTWFNFIYQTVITVTCTVKFPLPFVFWVIFGDEIIFRWPVGTSNHVLSCTFLPFRGNPYRVRRVCDVPNDHETSDVESSRNFCGCAVGTWHRPVKRGRKCLPIMWHILHFTSWKLCCNVGLCVLLVPVLDWRSPNVFRKKKPQANIHSTAIFDVSIVFSGTPWNFMLGI